jgi:hypothetical protein
MYCNALVQYWQYTENIDHPVCATVPEISILIAPHFVSSMTYAHIMNWVCELYNHERKKPLYTAGFCIDI